MSFARAVTHLLAEEGGYTNNPADPGGETAYGISKRAFPNLDISKLTEQQAIEIYSEKYWDPIHGDSLPDAVGFALLDFAVNSGVGEAIKALQRAIAVTVDGAMGPVTIAAVSRDPRAVVVGLSAERLLLLTKLQTWPVFGHGWAKRVIDTAIEALS